MTMLQPADEVPWHQLRYRRPADASEKFKGTPALQEKSWLYRYKWLRRESTNGWSTLWNTYMNGCGRVTIYDLYWFMTSWMIHAPAIPGMWKWHQSHFRKSLISQALALGVCDFTRGAWKHRKQRHEDKGWQGTCAKSMYTCQEDVWQLRRKNTKVIYPNFSNML